MTDRDSFLAAILAAPDDDTPRLVYADWLDDHGEAERAEFIRVQCKLAKMDDPITDTSSFTIQLSGKDRGWRDQCGECKKTKRGLCQYHALRRRERELLCIAMASPDWIGFDASRCDDWEFRRGFVEAITCSWEDCRDHLDAILKSQPVRLVRLTTWPKLADSLLFRRNLNADSLWRHDRWPDVRFEYFDLDAPVIPRLP